MSEYYEALIEKALPENLRVSLRLNEGATYGDAIAMGQARAAIKGKSDAAREIADRLEGTARQPVEVSGPGGGRIDLAERIARGRARLEEDRRQRENGGFPVAGTERHER